MDEIDRQRILAEARRHVDPARGKAQQEYFAQVLLNLPVEDPMVRWRADAEAAEAQRASVKRAMYRSQQAETAAAAAHATDWENWVLSKLREQRDFLVGTVGAALGQATAELSDDLLAKLDKVAAMLDEERRMHQRELKQLEQRCSALEKLSVRELAVTNSKVMALQRELDKLIGNVDNKHAHTKLDGLRDGLEAVRQDLMPIKKKFEYN
jgi:hypothetical protein